MQVCGRFIESVLRLCACRMNTGRPLLFIERAGRFEFFGPHKGVLEGLARRRARV